MNKLTIVVPIYNIEKYLNRCLTSLVNQTSKEFEVLCVNDGTKDNSIDIIDEFVKKDSRFKRLDKPNGGLSDARNYGLKHVDTKYVMFIDGDDYVEPYLVETCLKHMENDDLDMFVFAYNQTVLEKDTKEIIKMEIDDGVYCLEDAPRILAYTPNAAWNKCYKTSLFKDNGIEYPVGYIQEDLGTTAKLIHAAKRIGYSNNPLYNYIIDRPDNITSKIDKRIYHVLDMSKEIIDYYKKNNIYKKYKYELSYLVNRNLIQSLRKAVTSNDKEFVNDFIDTAYKFRKDNIPTSLKYEQIDVKGDYIYQSKLLTKLFYKYRLLFKKNK